MAKREKQYPDNPLFADFKLDLPIQGEGPTWGNGAIDVADREAIEERRRKEAEWDAYQRKYEGKTFEGVSGAMRPMPIVWGL